MSLLPLILQDDMDHLWDLSMRMPTHRFGLGLNGLDYYRPFGVAVLEDGNHHHNHHQQQRRKDGQQIANIDGPYKVNLNVKDFAPEEIKITADKNMITVEGKHEEKSDGDGLIWRHFVRKYLVPEGHDLDAAVSNLSSNGILTITAPKKNVPKQEPISIPITRIGENAADKK